MSRPITPLLLIGLIVVAVFCAPGCASTLTPAPEAVRVPGVERAARAAAEGVEIIASAGAWRGVPPNLEDTVTPMLVTITNESDRRLELRYEHFALVEPSGTAFAALPPFRISGIVYAPSHDEPQPVGFGLAPYLSPWYPGWSLWGGPFPYRAGYYDAYYTVFQRISLPTGDMIQKALPEGVLEPGGRLTGFIYFAAIEQVRRVTFVARLVDADTGAAFGAVEIPFIVE